MSNQHFIDSNWRRVMGLIREEIAARGLHPSACVVLVPYAQLMPQARLAWAEQGDAARHDARWSLQLAVVHGTAPRLSHVQLPVRPEDVCGAEETEKPCDPKDAALDAALDEAAAEPPVYDSAAEDSAAAATGATGTTGDVAPVGVPEDATATVATSAATATVATSLQAPSPADVADFAPAAVSSHVLQQLQRRVEQRRLEAQRSPDTALEARRSPAATGRRAVSSAREVAVVREIEISELEIAELEISIEARADVAGMAAAAMDCAAPAAAGGDAAVAPDVLACMRSPRRLATGGDAAVAPAAKAKATVAAPFDGELPNLATPLTWYEGLPRLAEALPPRGYVELLRAVAREHSRGAVVGAVEAAPESEGAFGLDLEHDLPFEVPA
jgi:hypothetical protein